MHEVSPLYSKIIKCKFIVTYAYAVYKKSVENINRKLLFKFYRNIFDNIL